MHTKQKDFYSPVKSLFVISNHPVDLRILLRGILVRWISGLGVYTTHDSSTNPSVSMRVFQ